MPEGRTETDNRQYTAGEEETPDHKEAPKTTEQWLAQVESSLRQVLSPDQQQRLDEVFAAAKKLNDLNAAEARKEPVGRQIEELFKELDIRKVKELLSQLETLAQEHPDAVAVSKEVEIVREELQEVKREATRRGMETGSVASATRGTLEQQVVENFAKYLDEGAVVHYGGDRVEIHRTSDGTLVITLPEPTFENMLALASQLGAFKETYGKDPQAYGDDLMVAAMMMDDQAIFSTEAIESLYNTGYKLTKIGEYMQGTAKYQDLRIIQEERRLRSGNKKVWEAKVNEVYKTIFLQKHDADFERYQDRGQDRLRIKKTLAQERGEKSRGLYDVLFDQWQKSDEGRRWMQENGGLEKMLRLLQDPKQKEEIRAKITTAYDEWLCNPIRRANLLGRMKGFMEKRVLPTRAEPKNFSILFARWRHMLLSTDSAKKIQEQFGSFTGESPLEKLKIITDFFQPDARNSQQMLNYLPSDVLKIFQQDGPANQRNEAACIIADSYVKHFLEAQGFKVFTHLRVNEGGTSAHTKLIAVNPQDGKAYFVDPNTPKGKGAAIEEITDPQLLTSLRKQQHGKWEVSKHIVTKTADNAVVADGDALLTSGFITNMIAADKEGKLSKELRWEAAQKAAELFPQNPIAWLTLAKLSTGVTRAEYFHHAQTLDPRITKDSLDKDIRIGAWNPVGIPPGSPYETIANLTNAQIAAVGPVLTGQGNTPTGGLADLDLGDLRDIREQILSEMRSSGGTPPPYAQNMLNEVAQAYINNRNQQQNAEGPQILSPLTGEQKRILLSGTPDEVLTLIEEEILDLADKTIPGALLPPQASERIQQRLRPMNQYLEARLSSGGGGPPQVIQKLREHQEYLTNVAQMFEGAFNVSGLIESGNPKKVEQARDFANQIDQEGGLTVLQTLSSIHEGRPVGLVSDLRREMKFKMQENFQREVAANKPGKYYLTQEDYLRLPKTIIEQQIKLAAAGVGPYAAKFRTQNPDGPGMEKIEEQIKMDVKFAQLIFTITGEASAIYIRGRLPGYTHDPGALAFMNGEWQGLDRYGEITGQNMEVAKRQFENASRLHLEQLLEKCEKTLASETASREAKEIAEKKAQKIQALLHNKRAKDLFDRYTDDNAVDILAPQVNMWWENRFIRTLPMIYALNEYEEKIGLSPQSAYEKRRVRDKNQKELDAPVGGDPEFGILLRAFFYVDGPFSSADDAIRLFNGKATDYFADMLIEPFSLTAAVGHVDKDGPADRRFIDLFISPASDFLNVTRLADETDYAFAIRRYEAFKTNYRPQMDAIRNKRINRKGEVPVQTNFALNDASPKSARADIQAAFGAQADDFQKFIAAMQNAVRDGGMATDLVEDPMFENQHYSPMSLIDVPTWMLEGNDLADKVKGDERDQRLSVKLGGNDRLGRYIGDVLELGQKSRAGLIQLLKTNPNQTEQIFKVVEQMADGIKNTRGTEAAHTLEIMAVGEYLQMMLPGRFADLIGATSPGLFKNTEYRKIMGKLVSAMSREEVFALVESHIMPTMGEEERKKFRQILRITTFHRTKRKLYQSILMLILSTIFQTTGSVFGVLNEGISKGAA